MAQFRYITYQQQLDTLLNNPYVSYSDNEKDKALNVIEKIGFSCINKYLNCFKVKMSFKDIYKLYSFDSVLKSESLRLIGLVERHIKSVVSNSFISNHEFDSMSYLETDNFAQKEKYKGLYNQLIKPFNKSKDEPFWTVLDYFALGDVIKIYELMKYPDQVKIARVFNKQPEAFKRELKLIKKFRNICAHFNDFLSQLDLTNVNFFNQKIIKFFNVIRVWTPDQDEWNIFIQRINISLNMIENIQTKQTLLKIWKIMWQS